MFDIGLDYPGIIMIVTEFQRVFVVFFSPLPWFGESRVGSSWQLCLNCRYLPRKSTRTFFFSEKTIENLCNNLKTTTKLTTLENNNKATTVMQ